MNFTLLRKMKMKIYFEVALTDNQIEELKENHGLHTEEAISEWMAEMYFWGAKEDFENRGICPIIDVVLPDKVKKLFER
jgi:hypothetical protein